MWKDQQTGCYFSGRLAVLASRLVACQHAYKACLLHVFFGLPRRSNDLKSESSMDLDLQHAARHPRALRPASSAEVNAGDAWPHPCGHVTSRCISNLHSVS